MAKNTAIHRSDRLANTACRPVGAWTSARIASNTRAAAATPPAASRDTSSRDLPVTRLAPTKASSHSIQLSSSIRGFAAITRPRQPPQSKMAIAQFRPLTVSPTTVAATARRVRAKTNTSASWSTRIAGGPPSAWSGGQGKRLWLCVNTFWEQYGRHKHGAGYESRQWIAPPGAIAFAKQ